VTQTRYTVKPTSRYRRDLRKAARQGKEIAKLEAIVQKLANGEQLDQSSRDHALFGRYEGCRECHIDPDWLLIYEVDEDILYLYLTRTGSHSDLFAM
jgi:mRNA interferase YafQ